MSAPDDFRGLLLVIRRPCDVCAGTGTIAAEDGEEFGRTGSRECGNCEGSGHVDDEMPIDDLVDAILARVPAAVIPRGDLEQLVGTVKASITAAALKSQGLADPDGAGSWLLVVQQGAEALQSVSDLLVNQQRGEA